MAKQFIDQFIKNLQPEEIKSVTRYIKNNVANGEESKTMEVFEGMLAGKEIKHKNKAALNKIKSRIFEKSLDGLLMDEQYVSSNFSEVDQTFIKLKTLLLQCKLLQRNKTASKENAMEHLCNQIISEAKKNEFFLITIEALNLKKYDLGQRHGIATLEKINKEIDEYDYCAKALVRAMDDYFRIILNDNFIQTYSEKEADQYIQDSISRMTFDFNKTKAQQINYYLHIIKFAFQERKKNYSLALKYCKDLIVLMQKHKHICRNERMGFAYDNLSLYYVYLNNFKLAEKYILKAKSYFNNNSFHNIIRTEQEFKLHFYDKNHSKASLCIESLLKESISVIGKFRIAKYTYFNACLLFAQKQYKEALALIIKPLEIEKDKERWNISIRILTVLIYIELEKHPEATRTLEALRKYMERNTLNDKIKPRDQLIIKTLRELEKHNFKHTANNTTIKKLHQQLSAKDKDVSWEYYSAELVAFHEWLRVG